MSKTVYKYILDGNMSPDPAGDFIRGTVQMPEGAIVRSAAMQAGGLVVWAEVDRRNVGSTVAHEFIVVPTGGEVPYIELEFVGTVFNGPFVWHIYWFNPS